MHTIEIALTDAQMMQLQALATERNVAVAVLLYEHLQLSLVPSLPPDEEQELAALNYLSTDALNTIATERLPSDVEAEMQILMDVNSLGEIDPSERERLTELVERSNRLMLRRSQAMLILQRRAQSH